MKDSEIEREIEEIMQECNINLSTMIENNIPLQGDMEDIIHQREMFQGDFHQEQEGKLCRKKHSKGINLEREVREIRVLG